VHAANDAGQLDRMSRANFKVRVTVQFDKFDRSTQEFGGPVRLKHPLGRRAMRPGFTARTDNKMGAAASTTFFRNDAAATEFDVVRVRAKGQ
jgi:hypothetical protein